ncbi:MAG: hypothetical protein Q9M17_06640 [Mariprofundus sp.]|nr:hypothetical protein [Mariprofundus sp.]
MSKMFATGWKEITNVDKLDALLGWAGAMVTSFFALIFADMNHVSYAGLIFIGLTASVFSTCCIVLFLGWRKEREDAASMPHMARGAQQAAQFSIDETHKGDYIQIPLIDMREKAIKVGWDFSEGSEQSMEFAFAISQAALEFEIKFWGRRNMFDLEEDNRTAELVPIATSHWINFSIDPVRFVYSTDNFYTRTFEFPNMEEKGFFDLYVDYDQAMQWLTTMTNEFKNKDLKQSGPQTES